MKKLTLMVAALIVVVGLIVWLKLKVNAAASDPEAAAEQAPSSVNLDAKNAALYDVTYRAAQETEGRAEAEVLRLTGQLEESPADAHETIDAWKKITTFQWLGKDTAGGTKLLGQAFVTHVEGGSVTHYLPKEVPNDLATVQLGFLDKLYVPIPLQETAELRRKEQDEVGRYAAVYVITKTNDAWHVSKTWDRYFDDRIKIDAVDNKIDYDFTLSGRLLSAKGLLTLHYREPAVTRFTTQIAVRAARAQTKTVTAAPKSSLRRASVTEVIAEAQQQSGQLTMEQAVQKFDAITEKTESKEVYRVFEAMKQDLRAHPEHADQVVAKIKSLTGQDPATRRKLSTAFGALAQSNSPAIADSLADLANTCGDNYCKVQALVALNDHPAPNPRNEAQILAMGRTSGDREIASTALLAAGSMGRKLGEGAGDLSSSLIAELNDPSQAEMKSTVLAAMGNHGDSAYLPSLQASLAAPNAEIRSAAAYSLRYIPGAQADNLLIGAFEKDADKGVASDALKALDLRNLTADQYNRVAARSATLDDHDLQMNAARMIAAAYHENPQSAQAAAQTLQANTKDPQVKAYISQELQTKTAAPSP